MEMESGGSRVVGEYIVGPQKIGSGSFSVVWKGRHRQQGVEVAVKEIDKRRLSDKVKDSLLKEITILTHVSHPNIVRLHQAIQTEEKIYLVLEYCPGGDLAAYIHRHGRVSESVARHFMMQLGLGLKVLRENNLIHRDLKPQNLLLCTKDETPVLKIGDFGFARYLMPQGLADTLCGSPLYMAPEIIQNKKYDAKADLWSVGAILFQLITGKPPFDGTSQFQLFQNVLASDELKFPQDIIAHLHPDCMNLCRSLLRQNPVERLTFEEFFNHKFMVIPRLRGSALEFTRNTADDNFEKAFGDSSNSAEAVKDKAINEGLLTASTSKVVDSLEFIEREYVLVHAHFASTETLSSSLETSLRNNSTAKLLSHTQKNMDIGNASTMQSGKLVLSAVNASTMQSGKLVLSAVNASTMQSGKLVLSAVCGAESAGLQVSAPLSVSRSSTASEDVAGTPSMNPSSRLKFFLQYVQVLTELANGKYSEGLHLDSFSIELVALAVWKEALQVCNSWMSSTSEVDLHNSFSTKDCLSHQKEGRLPLTQAVGSDFRRPFSVCSWVEQGFIHACNRAEKISNSFRDIDGNLEMPDAMEIIFQTALSAGKTGAVDELMGHRNRAVASYSKAITLLTFVLVEAPSLPLNPPFILSTYDKLRIHRYISNLRTHLSRSQMVEPHIKQSDNSPRK